MTPPTSSESCGSVETARAYLGHVLDWLGGRQSIDGPLLRNPSIRQRLASAVVAQCGAEALGDAAVIARQPQDDVVAGAVAILAAEECVRQCEAVHAGAGIFDPRPGVVHSAAVRARASLRCSEAMVWPPPLGRRHCDLSDALDEQMSHITISRDAALDEVTSTARDLCAMLNDISPVGSNTILDELVVAESLVALSSPGLAARVLTQRQVVRGYAGEGATAAVPTADLASGRVLTAVAVSEPTAGSYLGGMSSTVWQSMTGLRLTGTKTYVAGGADCDVVLVAAKHAGNTILVWADADRAEVSRSPLLGRAWRGVGFAEMRFENCPVTPAYADHADAGKALLNGLAWERMVLAAIQLGYARRWLAEPGVDRYGEFAWRIGAAHALLESAVCRADAGVPALVDSSMAKVAGCGVAAEIAAARLALAGPDADIESLLDDRASAWACTIAGGTASINLAIVEGRLSSFRVRREADRP